MSKSFKFFNKYDRKKYGLSFRLRKIYETRDYILEKIKNNYLVRKKHKQFCMNIHLF